MNNSFIGAIITNRDSSISGDHNRVFGADAVFQFYNRLDISGYILQSDTPGREGPSQARKFAVGWRDDDLSFGADYEKVEDDFNPEMGFIRRDDNSHYSGNFSYLPRLFGSDLIRNLTFRTSYDYWEGLTGEIETRGNSATFESPSRTALPSISWQIDTSYSRNDIEVSAGTFVTTLVSFKVLYAFSSRAFLNTFLQYNVERNQFSSNIRFNIIHHPLSDVYLVFNERRDTVTGEVLDRGVVFKFTNLFTF